MNNPVAKYMNRYNKPATFADKRVRSRKAIKRELRKELSQA